MSDKVRFSELETDQASIDQFVHEAVSKTEAALCDDAYEDDAQTISGILEDQEQLICIIRRGEWLYSFQRDANHPRGLWRRLPETIKPAPLADWRSVFDLDAFCKEDGNEWHWRGAVTLWSNPSRVLLVLSLEGSDQHRLLEWDCDECVAVEGGFDIPPARCSASWLNANTILLATSDLPGAATLSGWPRQVVRLERGSMVEDAPIEFEVGNHALLASAYTFPLREGGRGIGLRHARNIGDIESVLRFDGDDVKLRSPKNTHCAHNDVYYAYIAADDGPDAPGTLVLCRIDGTLKRTLFEPSTRSAVQAQSIYFDKNYLLWIELDTLEPSLRRLDLTDPRARPVTIPLPVPSQSLTLSAHDATDLGTGPLQLRTTGFLNPTQVWLFDPGIDPVNPDYKLLLEEKRTFDSTRMEVRLHMAPSLDGTEVPYHIVLPKSRTNPTPVLQYGYGGFGKALRPAYQKVKGPVWLEKGGAYVHAYIRGGTEFGKAWHLQAKGKQRLRAFEDFAAIAKDLVTRGYSQPKQIACHGASNGGLLCGVMLTRYPKHFGAVWASVGVMDMTRYHLFPAGAGWIDEYGDPDDSTARNWLMQYSPVHNVVSANVCIYPPALIDTNESDDRVDPSHSRRFAAILDEADQPVMFHSRAGGHGGGGRSDAIAREQALGFAFLRKHLSL